MATDTSNGLEQAAGHPWFHAMSRVGLIARGFLYLLIGWLALRVAFGGSGPEADRKGALQIVADKPGGQLILALMVAGFAALALWQCAEAAYGRPVPDGDAPTKRLASAGRALVYAAGCAATLAFQFGYQGKSSDQQSKTLTARLMGQPGGRWLVLAIAAAVVVWGAVVIVNAARRTFMDELETARMGRLAQRAVQPFGVIGNTSRGLVAAAVGAFLAYAALTFQPDKAKGLDGALREFATTPAGPWGLAALAAGVLTFGLYSLSEAHYRKLNPTTRPT
ncbi:DUF1206 domain-containing protein [Actinomadura meridiana]|uniref:DUF1206 domain-containing protein n=1 Tax=Actinomadura meridiana TaxID=559626 RepID=UPI0031E7869C